MANRWYVYQRERFPLLAHGALIAAFSFSTISYSFLLRGGIGIPDLRALVVAFATSLLFFLELRIADEFKDFEEDSRYRPYRPVPRGLVTLRELGVVGALAAAVQLGLALWLDPRLTIVLLFVWLYLAAMSKEFWIGPWLRAHPITYMLSHMVIIPMIDFYATACDWLPAGDRPPSGLWWLVAASYANGLVIEIGRKVRAPQDEELGVDTYSRLWRMDRALAVWWGVMLATAAMAIMAAVQIDFALPAAALLGIALAAAGFLARWMLKHPVDGAGKRIEAMSGVWTILLYLSMGAVPLMWRWWTESGGS